MPALKFPKNWLRTLGYRQKIHHFFFSHKWGTRFRYLSKLCPYILMYSALHIMQWFSQVLDVFTPKIKRNFSNFYILWIKTNVAYTRLEMIARTKYCTTTTASNWFVTLYYKLLPAVRSSSKNGRWRSSLLLYSISMDLTYPLASPSSSSHNAFLTRSSRQTHLPLDGQLGWGGNHGMGRGQTSMGLKRFKSWDGGGVKPAWGWRGYITRRKNIYGMKGYNIWE